jgi:hypothetical protein
MQLTKTVFPDSALFIEKKRVEIDCGEKTNFCGEKKNIIRYSVLLQAKRSMACLPSSLSPLETQRLVGRAREEPFFMEVD